MNRMVLSESSEIIRIFLEELTRITGTRLVGNKLCNYAYLGDSRKAMLHSYIVSTTISILYLQQ